MVLRKRGDEQGAQQAFEAALAVDPSFVDAHLSLAEIHFGRGDLDAAERSIEAALEADPASEGALRGREILRSLRAAQGSAE
jgi:Tfp pilus assembly protein PilF